MKSDDENISKLTEDFYNHLKHYAEYVYNA